MFLYYDYFMELVEPGKPNSEIFLRRVFKSNPYYFEMNGLKFAYVKCSGY
jgi:hypothetical protein